jgi:hypothetical protein
MIATTNLVEVSSRHVTNPPALVAHGHADLLEELILDLGRGELLSEGNQILDREEADRVLVVGLQTTVDGEAVRHDVRFGERLHERL